MKKTVNPDQKAVTTFVPAFGVTSQQDVLVLESFLDASNFEFYTQGELLNSMGPFVPVVFWVPADKKEQARQMALDSGITPESVKFFGDY